MYQVLFEEMAIEYIACMQLVVQRCFQNTNRNFLLSFQSVVLLRFIKSLRLVISMFQSVTYANRH